MTPKQIQAKIIEIGKRMTPALSNAVEDVLRDEKQRGTDARLAVIAMVRTMAYATGAALVHGMPDPETNSTESFRNDLGKAFRADMDVAINSIQDTAQKETRH